jgi:hypothetical protein
MSYRLQLQQRCAIIRLSETQVDGLASTQWSSMAEDVRCFLDLNYLRAGKDPIWTPDSGNAENRSGVLFLEPGADIRPGDRVQMSKGPSGTFEVKSSIDEAWTPRKLHHLECYVQEVNRLYVPGG